MPVSVFVVHLFALICVPASLFLPPNQESPHDDNLPALNVIVAIAGRFFQQAEV